MYVYTYATLRSDATCGLQQLPRPAIDERLAEYGWKPHRDCLAQRNLSRASIYWYMREQQRGTVSSNSRVQTALVQQYSANLSIESCHGMSCHWIMPLSHSLSYHIMSCHVMSCHVIGMATIGTTTGPLRSVLACRLGHNKVA